MGSARQNQKAAPPETDTLALEDETLNTNKAATVVPLLAGAGKTTIRWITPIYYVHAAKIQTSNVNGKGK